MNDQPKIELQEKILETIHSKNIKMRPRWQFLLEKISLETTLVLTFFLLSGLLSLLYLYTKGNQIHRMIEFGPAGWWFFVSQFPFELIIILVSLLYILGFVAKKLEISYRMKPANWYGLIIVSLLLLVAVSEIVGIHKALDEFEDEVESPYLKPYLNSRLHNIQQNSLNGEVVDDDGSVTIFRTEINRTPTTTIIFHRGINLGRPTEKLDKGEKIHFIGHWNKEEFVPVGAYQGDRP